jgi:hypothetical protein
VRKITLQALVEIELPDESHGQLESAYERIDRRNGRATFTLYDPRGPVVKNLKFHTMVGGKTSTITIFGVGTVRMECEMVPVLVKGNPGFFEVVQDA